MKKYVNLLSALLLCLLCGCGFGQEPDGGRERVTVALWSDQLVEHYAPYLQERFPEVDFTFYVATNSADFYRFKYERDDLPDILMVRRFALRDVADWKDALLDLSDTELANTFFQSYLRSYTYEDGTVNWLPVCAEVDSLVVNRVLLEENGLSLPGNYQEFVDLCAALRKLGIRPILSNFGADFTCMEMLQGLSAEQLSSQAGREWRQQYESGRTNQLSEEVWLPVFQRMEEFLDYTGITAADADLEHTEVLAAFQNGEAAIMRGTGNEEAIRKSEDGECMLLPYFGTTKEDNWYLTYPAFQAAASIRANESPKRRELILSILTAMLDQSGLEHIASGRNMIPYSRDATLSLSAELAYMQSYIDNNRLYIRLASSDMFAISQKVVQGMITGKYPDARSAFDAFNAEMNGEKAMMPAAAHIETGYSYEFNPESGSPAASAVMNSVRDELGTQLLLGQAFSVAGNISAGDYTEAELQFLTMGEPPEILLCNMTGEQVYQYLEYLLATSGNRWSVSSDSMLYVSSGFEMAVRKTSGNYILEELTINGAALEREAVYSVALAGCITEALEAAGVTEYEKAADGFKQILTNRLMRGTPLSAPDNYIKLY